MSGAAGGPLSSAEAAGGPASARWRRLDTPGHDACRLQPDGDGWTLEGTAEFLDAAGPAHLAYRVECDARWRTRRGEVRGRLGDLAVDTVIVRAGDGTWTRDGAPTPGLEPYLDLDFGFTPATNLQQLRRLALRVGEAAELPVVWFDPGSRGELTVLAQRYERRSHGTYWYESPSVPYAALLEMAPNGFTRRYPGLWELDD